MASIGPTAHYTGEVWARNGLSHPELQTTGGKLLRAVTDTALLPLTLLGGPSLEGTLLARHETIDAELEAAIAAGTVGQVLEIACGMSPRGWRFTERHQGLVYVEADLPDMAARKREALERIGRPSWHRVAEIDALADAGPRSLAAVAAAQLDPGQGTAVITEGLLNYLPREAVCSLWAHISAVADLYLSDLFVREDSPALIGPAFSVLLSAFVCSPVSLHFADAEEATAALLHAGFAEAELLPAERVHVVRAVGR
jgi:O-methyltransferase involved in polyketide biosynthesis